MAVGSVWGVGRIVLGCLHRDKVFWRGGVEQKLQARLAGADGVDDAREKLQRAIDRFWFVVAPAGIWMSSLWRYPAAVGFGFCAAGLMIAALAGCYRGKLLYELHLLNREQLED